MSQPDNRRCSQPYHDQIYHVFERAQTLGFIGPGPIGKQLEHSDYFLQALDGVNTGFGLNYADIGAGAGLPSLPILLERPLFKAVLFDSSQKRCSFLAWALGVLGLSSRVEIHCCRVEQAAHQSHWRTTFKAVVARGFGPPAFTVECGAALLTLGGKLLISEPPEPRQWPIEGLSLVGCRYLGGEKIALIEREGDLSKKYPRRVKLAQREPLFH